MELSRRLEERRRAAMLGNCIVDSMINVAIRSVDLARINTEEWGRLVSQWSIYVNKVD